MKDIKELLIEENEAHNLLSDVIHKQSESQLWLRGLLERKKKEKLTDKQAFHEAMDAVEKEAEEIIASMPPAMLQTLDKIQEANKELADIDIGIKQLEKKLAKEDDLGADILPLPLDAFPEDENAIVSIPANEAKENRIRYLQEQDEMGNITAEEAAELERLSNGDTEEEMLAEQQAKENLGTQESFSLNITLNEDQLAAKEMAYAGKSFCLIGAAGTGKTTAQRAIAEALLLDNRLSNSTFKTYDKDGKRQYVGAPSIAFCAFTRRAAANLAKAVLKSPVLQEKLKNNIMTIHSLLEFEPVTYTDWTEGKAVEKFKFAPMRTAENPLNITHLIVEEASMLDAMTLWGHLYDALPPGVQIIFIGDINQLPPVFGPSILNYALVQLPIIELKKVYRNQGIVLENAHRILKGETLLENNNFEIIRGNKPVQVGQEKLSRMLGDLFNQWMEMKGDDGLPIYDPEDCMILSPFNKQPVGTDNLNAWIAQHLGTKRGAVVHEIIAGFNKVYLAKGDKVMFNKLDGVIDDIYRNPDYHGKEPQIAGSDLTRFGVRKLGGAGKDSIDDLALDYSNFSLEALEAEKAERKMQASHTVRIILENGKIEEVSAAGDFAPAKFSLGYALTVHKAQGSEWRKVFLILHKDHAVMLYRELFYTAVTRARTKVAIISKDFVIEKAIGNQRIKGNTIRDKIEFFNSGAANVTAGDIYATK